MDRLLPDVQLSLRPGLVDFAWGHPDMALLPEDGIARAASVALQRDGASALAYGAEQGPGRLIYSLQKRLARLEGVEYPADQILITGGISQALDLLCTLSSRPGDAILVESPTYHLALRIFRDHGLRLVPVASDEYGLRVDAAEAAVQELRKQGQQPRLLYLVPTYGNPTGIELASERRLALVSLATREGLLVLEDDAYRELWYDGRPSPPLFGMAPVGPVIRLNSFSKILAPGLRLGWALAPADVVQRCVKGGLLDSGGGINHFTAHVVAAAIDLGVLDEHVEMLRSVYRQRRDTLLSALARYLPQACRWARPGGGFFVWLSLPKGTDSAALLPQAEASGVSYVPGARFAADASPSSDLRLSFSLLPPDALAEGARRLGEMLKTVLRA